MYTYWIPLLYDDYYQKVHEIQTRQLMGPSSYKGLAVETWLPYLQNSNDYKELKAYILRTEYDYMRW